MAGIRLINYRPHGYETEKAAAVALEPRRETLRDKMLRVYLDAPGGLTDDAASHYAGLNNTCYWKRCGELRALGYISTLTVVGKTITREGDSGVQRIVCWITDEGREYLQGK